MKEKYQDRKENEKEATDSGEATFWQKLRENYQPTIAFVLVGLTLVGAGILGLKVFDKDSEVEIVSVESQNTSQSSKTIFVDIEGAVMKPGLYELPPDSRINDLLVKAGGLSGHADREWVQKNINLAQKLNDGGKIYISGKGTAASGKSAIVGVSSTASTININSAALAELDTLEGIGAKRAQDIINGRPYQSIEELVNRKIISKSVFEKIKDKISVY